MEVRAFIVPILSGNDFFQKICSWQVNAGIWVGTFSYLKIFILFQSLLVKTPKNFRKCYLNNWTSCKNLQKPERLKKNLLVKHYYNLIASAHRYSSWGRWSCIASNIFYRFSSFWYSSKMYRMCSIFIEFSFSSHKYALMIQVPLFYWIKGLISRLKSSNRPLLCHFYLMFMAKIRVNSHCILNIEFWKWNLNLKICYGDVSKNSHIII